MTTDAVAFLDDAIARLPLTEQAELFERYQRRVAAAPATSPADYDLRALSLEAEPPAGDLVDPGDAAKLFKKSKDTIRRWLRDSQKAGCPIGEKLGGRWMISMQRAKAFSQSQ